MIGAHPGGLTLTRRLLGMADVPGPVTRPGIPAKVLDLGAGTGESVRYLRSLGYDAVGIDREVKADQTGPVTAGDMTALP